MELDFLAKSFTDVTKIGEGTYGVVIKAKSIDNGKYYAIKLCRPKSSKDNELGGHFDIPYTSLREVIVLKQLFHPNIIRLKHVKFTSKNFALIFPLYPSTLEDVIKVKKKTGKFNLLQIKKYLYQLILAMDYMHRNRIIHRDLKPENVFLDDEDNVRVGDFGLSRVVTQPLRPYTNEVMTMIYRPPELVLGETCYCIGIDIWALGCIMAELYLGKPLFNDIVGELEMLHLQFKIFGTPSDKEWPRMSKLKNFNKKMLKLKGEGIKSVIPEMDDKAVDLIESMMKVNPDERTACSDLLKHSYFDQIKSEGMVIDTQI